MAEFKEHHLRDHVTLKDEDGNLKSYLVEATFDMDEKSYALLKTKDEMILVRIEGDEVVGLANEEERDAILDAYQIAVDAVPADDVDKQP